MADIDKVLLQAARRVIASELRCYDRMSRPAKLRYEAAVQYAVDESAFPQWICCHDRRRDEVCEACGRDSTLASEYRSVMIRRLKELTSLLEVKQ